ncbi:MAG: flagellar biosynthesis protein FliQ [Planctomycetota bacterium]
MNPEVATDLVRQTLILTLLVSAPILLVGLAVGVVISLLQALTQVQEQTLSFIPKIMAMVIVAAITLPWTVNQVLSFAREMMSLAPPM